MTPNIVFAGPEAASGAASAEQARGIDPRRMEVMRQHPDTHGDEHEKLRDRIRTLEESLKRLGRESLERAKHGMERLAEKYDTGAQPLPPGRAVPCEGLGPLLPPSVEALGVHTTPAAQTQQALAPASFATS